MTEICHAETSLRDPARRHDKMRQWLIDALSLATAVSAVFHYNPDSMLAAIIVFAGAYVVANPIWLFVCMTSGIILGFLSALLYLSGLVMALSSLPAMLLSAFLPGIAQAYWIWALWPATCNWLHPLTLGCTVWLIAFAIWMSEQKMLERWLSRQR